MNALIYDIEIVNAVPDRVAPRQEGITYCSGWTDHGNMGVSVIGCYDYAEERYRVFCEDNHAEFAMLCKARDQLVGFNSAAFDNAVLCATYPRFDWAWHDDPPGRCYDLLVEIWAASGLGPRFTCPSHAGFGLDVMCAATFGAHKTGHGALAPVDWQRGRIGSVIDYCLNDVRLTKLLFDRALQGAAVKCPKTGNDLMLRAPV